MKKINEVYLNKISYSNSKMETRSQKLKVTRTNRKIDMKKKKKELKKVLYDSALALCEQIELRNTVVVKASSPELTDEIIEAYSADYRANSNNELRRNIISELGVENSSLNRDYLQQINKAYSHNLPKVPRVASQYYSGRCWLFAATNMMRTYMIADLNLNDHFELSEAYLFFWDKLERAHNFLETMLDFRNKDSHDAIYNHCLFNLSPVNDGGNWSYVCNLVQKYGVVPKTVYGESFNSSYSDEMNEVLHTKLCLFNTWIRNNTDVPKQDVRKKIVREMMPEIYALLASCLGEPPKPQGEFVWEYNEAGENFESSRQKGQYCRVEGLSPLQFYDTYVKPFLNLDEMVHLVHDPREENPKNRTYRVDHSGQMVGGMPEIMFNVDMDVMRVATAASIMENNPVWFACDVGKDFEPFSSFLATEAFQRDKVLGTELSISKEDGLRNLVSYPTHAMTFVGLNTTENDPELVTKWKVENSWGENGYDLDDPGYLHMTDAWFRRNVYSVIVNIKYLPLSLRAEFMDNKYIPITLPYNDPLSSVAKIKIH